MIFKVCLRCAIERGVTVRELIGHAVWGQALGPKVLCWCK